MNAFRRRPFFENTRRYEIAAERRRVATDYAARYAARATEQNADEIELEDDGFGASFTKGLAHDEFAQLENNSDYVKLVNRINEQDAQSFDDVARGIHSTRAAVSQRKNGMDIEWRGWESPRSGHYYDLQGPDADSVSMPPAPALGSEELTAEMAEVYALALLRDVPFTSISGSTGMDSNTGITVTEVLNALSNLSWFTSDTDAGLSLQERRRRAARKTDHGSEFPIDNPPDANTFDPSNAFRGSAPGAKAGPYVSQFMLLGNKMSPAIGNKTDATINYGRQVIDQKIEPFQSGSDYMVHWNAYLDVQNGANFGSDTNDAIVPTRRFITTPRDLAAYVRYDQLYQAYLNACLFMLEDRRFGFQREVTHRYTGLKGPGFPDGRRVDPNTPPSRQAFASFGGPHVLSMVTEVATRCLKAVRRQKFNYHRRARPERIGALLTLQGTNGKGVGLDVSDELGSTTSAHLATMLNAANLGPMLALVDAHNQSRLAATDAADPHLNNAAAPDPAWFANTENYLLPMAFAEGSPMHPSYGAGHATVAGGCVTMLKAFFDTTDDSGTSHPWPVDVPVLQATANGAELEEPSGNPGEGMTISGELNKLAANISIGRNMGGVHYYTDYYESLRMGERIAAGILIEQTKHYNEPVEFSFESFDGDHVHILKNDLDYAEPRVFITNSEGDDVDLDDWWNRHTAGEVEKTQTLFAANRTDTANRANPVDLTG